MRRMRSSPLSSSALSMVVVLTSLFLLIGPMAQAQNGRAVLITQSLDESKLITLAGNTRPEANKQNDRGLVADDQAMDHMMLQLKRSPQQERQLQQFIQQQEDKSSPNFHHWLTAKEYGARFGLAAQDLDMIMRWLESHGFKVNVVYENGTLIDFSGTASQVRAAFHTEIHQLSVNGVTHFANMSDPQIPAALAPAVVGVVSLHDFKPHTNYKPRSSYTPPGDTCFFSTCYLVAPADLATIYNLNPLFTAGISGQGQTIVVIEDTDVYNFPGDWNTFRSTFGLSTFTGGSFTQVHPAPGSGTNNCTDPGVNGDDGEAILDAEYASAAAPSAAIELASCSGGQTGATFGGLIALQNLLNESGTPPAVVSISYGECEAGNGASANAAYSAAYQQAVGEGVSVFVSSGDEGAASCDANLSNATHGIGVSGFASTPYNVAVGGTDFGDTYAGTNTTYWSTTNSPTYESALSYVPEIPWNDSCANVLLSFFVTGSNQTYGTAGFCNNTLAAQNGLLTTASGSGGPSGCATGTASTSGVVSGSCAGWPKPSWQSVVGNPTDTVRDIPDVSLFAANGVWDHYYPFCYSDPNFQGSNPCTGTPDTWSGAGGTSFASPIMAGIQALINQKAGGPQGNPNPVYYALAAAQYGATGDTTCNSTLGNTTSSTCVFYDVTQGDMDVNCTGTHSCYLPSGTFGVLSTSNSSYLPAFGTTTGWDFATGIGTINAYNLANAYVSEVASFTLSASPSTLSVAEGGNGTSTITVIPGQGFTGTVSLAASGLPTGVTASFNPSSTTTTSTLTLTASASATLGAATVTITGTSGTHTATTTISLAIVTASTFTLSANPVSVTLNPGLAGHTSTITVTDVGGFTGAVSLTASGLPAGVTASFNPTSTTTTSTLTLTASGSAAAGTTAITITGTSGALTATTTVNVTVTPPPSFTLTAAPTTLTVTPGASGATSTITVITANGFASSVSLAASGLPSGVTASFNPASTTTTSTLTLTANLTATPGPATVTITGTSGLLSASTTVSLNVNQLFTLSTPTTPPAPLAGESTTSTFNVTATNGSTFVSPVTFACNGLPDATVSCTFSSIAAGATSPQQVTVTIQTTGPNTGLAGGVRRNQRRADNRSPWLPVALPLAGIVMAGLGRKASKRAAVLGLCILLAFLGVLAACGGGGSAPIGVTVAQQQAVYPNYTNWPNQTVTFTATVSHTTDTAVTWGVSPATTGGSINSTSGVYTAPTVALGLPASATITATSVADTTKTGSTVETIKAVTVPTAIAGGPYNITVAATEGTVTNNTAAIQLTVD